MSDTITSERRALLQDDCELLARDARRLEKRILKWARKQRVAARALRKLRAKRVRLNALLLEAQRAFYATAGKGAP